MTGGVTRHMLPHLYLGTPTDMQTGPKKVHWVRASLHGGGGPQVVEVTCFGVVTRLSKLTNWTAMFKQRRFIAAVLANTPTWRKTWKTSDFYNYGRQLQIKLILVKEILKETQVNYQASSVNVCLFNHYYYSCKIFPRFWLAKSTRIIHHNQLLIDQIWKNFVFNEPMTSKVQLSFRLILC